MEFAYFIVYPEIGEIHLIARAKPWQHQEPWKITVKNGEEERSSVVKEGYLYLKVPIHFGENKLTVAAELGVPVDAFVRIELFDFITFTIERNE